MNHYIQWNIIKFIRLFVAYIILLPLCLVLLPFTKLGDWLGMMFYDLSDIYGF